MPSLHDFFNSPSKWCKGTYARDANGHRVDSLSPDAVCWCLRGAMRKCFGSANPLWSAIAYKLQTHPEVCNSGIADWNDAPDTTYEDVVRVCKELNV